MTKSPINPQPFAVERKDKQLPKEKPSNLAGSEMDRKPLEKKKK